MSEQQPAEIRASDQERERIGEMLREATVEGRLTLDEFSERYMLAQRARTRNELQVIVRDLPALSRPERQQPPSKVTAIMSSVDRTGVWRLAPTTSITAIMGSCKLDLRKATISSDVTTLDVRVVMGSLELLVPPGVDVEVEAAIIMASREIKMSRATAPTGGRPLIRITGMAIMGSVNVRDMPNLSERLKESIMGMFEQPSIDNRR